ncbi:MAG: L-threonylcarbamoyladenylate synthase [Gammaproteobacteria bacterium]
MTSLLKIRQAAIVVRSGGVVAYPTEGVYGLGCDPGDGDAVARILELKKRPASAGLILIAADAQQLDEWIAPGAEERQRIAAGADGITWVVTAAPDTPEWITGGRATVAVRVTHHPVAAALCAAAHTPLVSTSANRRGCPPALTALAARRTFGAEIDCVLAGPTGGRGRPSEIRDARTGTTLRAG